MPEMFEKIKIALSILITAAGVIVLVLIYERFYSTKEHLRTVWLWGVCGIIAAIDIFLLPIIPALLIPSTILLVGYIIHRCMC